MNPRVEATAIVTVIVAITLGCASAHDDRRPTPKQISDGLRKIEQCLIDHGYSTENVAAHIRSNPKFRNVVDICGQDSGVGADDVLATDARITELNNDQVLHDQACMRRGGFEIATYRDQDGTMHLEDFDSKYVNPSNVDQFFDVYAECVNVPRSNYPSSNGFPTTTVSRP